MEKAELVILFKHFNDVYQSKFKFPKETEGQNKSLIESWMVYLKEYDTKLVQTIARKLVVNNPEWPPTVGQIVQAIEGIKTPDELTPGEAWAKVIRAIQVYGTIDRDRINQAMNSLPEKVRKAVECVGGLRVIGMSSDTDTFMMNQFKKVYQEISDKVDNQYKLPKSIREETQKLAKRFKTPVIEGD